MFHNGTLWCFVCVSCVGEFLYFKTFCIIANFAMIFSRTWYIFACRVSFFIISYMAICILKLWLAINVILVLFPFLLVNKMPFICCNFFCAWNSISITGVKGYLVYFINFISYPKVIIRKFCCHTDIYNIIYLWLCLYILFIHNGNQICLLQTNTYRGGNVTI